MMKIYKRTAEVRARMGKARLGYKYTKEAKARMSEAHLGHKATDETKAKMSKAHLGNHCALGCRRTVEEKAKLRQANSGERGTNWRGGIHTPYGLEFNLDLKTIIRKRDDYLCQNPNCYMPENGCLHTVHHIDFNKGHDDPVNLITLCRSHHGKSGRGDRASWMEYYQALQIMRGIGV